MAKWFDPLDLSNQKKLLDLGYIYPRGVRGGVALFFFGKSVFLKHPIEHPPTTTGLVNVAEKRFLKLQKPLHDEGLRGFVLEKPH